MRIAVAALRAFQLLFAVVVLGITISLLKGEYAGSHYPATTIWGAVAGGIGIVTAIIGITSLKVDVLDGTISIIADIVAAICFMTAGIAVAVGMRGANCSDWRTVYINPLVAGCVVRFQGQLRGCYELADKEGKLQGRCRQNEAEAVFHFLAFLTCAALAVTTVLIVRRGGKSGSS